MKKLKMKRQALKAWIREHMHAPVGATLETLNRKLQGHTNYYGINGNFRMIEKFFKFAKETYIRALRARSQKRPIRWDDFIRIWDHYIKPPKIAVQIWPM
jgi:hypothetical protein